MSEPKSLNRKELIETLRRDLPGISERGRLDILNNAVRSAARKNVEVFEQAECQPLDASARQLSDEDRAEIARMTGSDSSDYDLEDDDCARMGVRSVEDLISAMDRE